MIVVLNKQFKFNSKSNNLKYGGLYFSGKLKISLIYITFVEGSKNIVCRIVVSRSGNLYGITFHRIWVFNI